MSSKFVFISLIFLIRLFPIRLFVDLNKLSKSLQDDLQLENISLYPYDSFYQELKTTVQSVDHDENISVSDYIFEERI
jgi:hypothetical protein